MDESSTDIQSQFLGLMVAKETPVWVFLTNGIKLAGDLASFDTYVLTLRSASTIQIVYKNAVSTVVEQHARPVGTTDHEPVPERRPRRYETR